MTTTATSQQSLLTGSDLMAPAADAPPDETPSRALADLRTAAMSVPVPVMRQALAEYAERRQTFRDWLLAHLVEGLHFGIPPGCEAKRDAAGNVVDKKGNIIDPRQWRHKPSLYKAGADFVCDLLGARDDYEADKEGWIQAGSEAGKFVTLCTLTSRATGEKLGQGRGLARAGDEQLGANSALKKSEKRAKVAAVLNAWGLADLFSQDLEDGADRERHENPAPEPSAPQAAARNQRLGREKALAEIQRLGKWWDDIRGPALETPEQHKASWLAFLSGVTAKESLNRADNWTATDVELVEAELRNREGGAS